MIKGISDLTTWKKVVFYGCATVCTVAFVYFIGAWIFGWPFMMAALYIFIGSGILGAVLGYMITRKRVIIVTGEQKEQSK